MYVAISVIAEAKVSENTEDDNLRITDLKLMNDSVR